MISPPFKNSTELLTYCIVQKPPCFFSIRRGWVYNDTSFICAWTAPLSLTNSHVCCVYNSLNISFLSQCSKPYCGFLHRRVFTRHARRLCLSLSHSSLSFCVNSTVLAQLHKPAGYWGRRAAPPSLCSLAACMNTKRWTAWQTGWNCWSYDQKYQGTMSPSISHQRHRVLFDCVVRNTWFCFMDSHCHWIYWKYWYRYTTLNV